jgi:plastocyanin
VYLETTSSEGVDALKRRLLISFLAVAATAVVSVIVFLPSGAAADGTTLKGSVGPGFLISLKDANGAAVSHLDPGTYTINVDDLGVDHNFHLSGPGVDQATGIDETGSVTWTVTLSDGTYKFVCDAHANTMKGSFTVGAVTQPPPPPPPPSGVAKGTKLKGTVGPGFTITLKDGAGKAVKRVKSGTTYRIAVADKSSAHNFHLSGPGINKRTAVGKRASTTWKVKFKKGTFKFQCDPHRTVMKGSFKAV